MDVADNARDLRSRIKPISDGERRRVAVRTVARKLIGNRGALIGLIILLTVAFLGVAAPLVAPHDPNHQSLPLRLHPPFQDTSHTLGTDQLGRDVLSRLIYGSRIALIVGITTVLISGAVGVTFGLSAGFYGGRLDDFLSWLVNVFLAFPFILLAIAVVAVLGGGLRNIIVVLALTSWMSYMRIIRGEVFAVRETTYIEAARSIGVRDARLLGRHVLPNVMTPVTIIATFEVARMIISESALSFLGLGVGAHTPSWGGMLADGRAYLSTGWWVATFPGLAIMLTVLAINLLGDWLRDELDPRLRN